MEKVWKVTTVLSRPYVMLNSSGGYEGFMVDLLDKLSDTVRFKYDLHLVKDGNYGGMERDGTWNGMVGELVRREADIAAAGLTVTAARERVVVFTKPFLSESVRLLVKKPLRAEIGLGSLLQPFTSEVWLCLIFAALAVSILFMLIGRFNPYEWRQVPTDKDPRGARHSFGLRDSLMFVFSSMFVQGYRETPRSLAGRILAVSWFACVLFTLVAYIGNVGAFLRVETGMTFPFQGVEDLTKQTAIRVGAIKGGTIYRNLQSSNIEVYKRLFEYMDATDSFVKTTQEGVERVRTSSGRFVMLIESSSGQYEAERKSCDLTLYGPALFSSGLALAVPIGSPLKDRLNLAILQLRENGSLQRLQRKWWNSGQCGETDIQPSPKADTVRSHALGVRSLGTAFLLLLIGAIVAAVVMLAELLFKKFRQ